MIIKICGMSDQGLIRSAENLGVDWCGFIFHASSPRNIAPTQAAMLQTGAMKRVGVFVKQSVEETLRIVDEAKLDFIQLHGGQSTDFAKACGVERVIAVFMPKHYGSMASLQKAIDLYAGSCACYLLDAGMGSGMTLDWQSLAKLRFPHPWLLSGGLGKDNLQKALEACNPDGVDLNSRLESSPGVKDESLMSSAVRILRKTHKDTV